MCGRAYETYTDEEIYIRYKNRRPIRFTLGTNYNLCPTQISPVIVVRDGDREVASMRWGLVPAWAQDMKAADKYSLINAQGEDIETKRSYQAAFRSRRCIVPVSGFFEWKREGKQKTPFAIHLCDDSIMSLAGVWELWRSKETDEEVSSFSIITTAANSFMESIHYRMPVILDREDEEAWLDPVNQNVADLKSLLRPCGPEKLACFPISTLVNSPRNNSPEVLVPAK
jgi:putative SOS response-associated peptidase YedK